MIGRKLNSYKILSEIGVGGMGVVYKAYDPKLDRNVAIKVLKGSQSQNVLEFIHRFKKEAKNQAKLSHQNIVPVYDFIEEDGKLAIVMEYVEGETLEHMIERKGKIDIFEAVDIIKQVLSGVNYAHLKGFIHRDIKPSNIIMSLDGVVKMMDFGISKYMFEKSFTRTGRNIGTLLYMSPEQIKGEELTPESDIYSIGVTLFEMLTGQPPFAFDNEYQLCEAHINQKPPEISNGFTGIPILIQNVIFKALEKRPSERYLSASEFLETVEKAESEIKKDSYTYGKRKPNLKYRIKALIYTSLIVLAGISVFYFIFTQILMQWKNGKENFLFDAESTIEIKEEKENPLIKLNRIRSGTNETLNAIYFVNDTLAFCCGTRGTLLRSTDKGYNWVTVNLNDSVNFYGLHFNSAGSGFVCCENGSLYNTIDYGVTWNKVLLPTNSALFRIVFIDEETGFITSGKGKLFKTSNSGIEWNEVNTNVYDIIYDIHFVSNLTGFAVTKSGKILNTSDGGDSWEVQKTFSNTYIKSIDFVNSKKGFAVGSGGEIYFTNNGGNSWQKFQSSISSGLYDILFFSEQKGLIVGSQGKILSTQDSGKTWSLNDFGNTSSFNHIAVNSTNDIFLVGANGSIVRTRF